MSRLKKLLPALAVAAGLLSGCGAPPQPLATAPPPAPGSASAVAPSGSLPPVVSLPPTLAPQPPQTVAPLPTLPTTVPTTSPTPTVKPAAKCTSSGPSGAQILALVKGQPGIPDAELALHAGPYCSGSWQFTELELAGKSPDDVEPLLVVSTGKPASLTLIEAGTDVCSTQVQNDAPAGIRVRACGN